MHDGAGTHIKERRERLAISVLALASRAGIDRGVLTRIENGARVRSTSIRLVERALGELEHEQGIDQTVAAQTDGDDPRDGTVEFTIEGHSGVKAVVKGPIRDIDKLQQAVAQLIARMAPPT